MGRLKEQTKEESIDILNNEILDYVLSDYCTTKKCPYRETCLSENKECRFDTAIKNTITILNRRARRISELNKENRMLKSLLRKD